METVTYDSSPHEELRARELLEKGYLPVSNKYRLVSWAPFVCVAEAIAKKESEDGEDWGSAIYPEGDPRRGKQAMYRDRLRCWEPQGVRSNRDFYARVYGESIEVPRGVYRALKRLYSLA